MSRQRRHSKRSIIVDGVTYTWRYGNWIEIRRGRDVVLRQRVTEILDVTWDDLERAKRKGYGFPLTPARIATLIRSTLNTSKTEDA